MAKVAKIAGIASALAIGLGSGVLLAVMNPLIPNEDATQVAAAPQKTQAIDLQQDKAPKAVELNPDQSVQAPKGAQPASGQADSTPQVSSQGAAKVKTGTASGLSQPQVNQADGPSAVALPGQTEADQPGQAAQLGQPQAADGSASKPSTQTGGAVQIGAASEMDGPELAGNGDAAPALPTQRNADTPTAPQPMSTPQGTPRKLAISTAPAAPVVLAEPAVDTTVVKGQQTAPKTATDSEITAPSRLQEGRNAEAPKQMQPASDVVAALPSLPEPKRKVNKSGTFDTSSSRLPTAGSSVFNSRNNSGSGVKFPKIGLNVQAEKPAVENAIGALERNAVEFAPTDKPLLSIVLIDIGDEGLPVEVLKKLTIPVAFALPADQQGVGQRAQEYIDAGFEVLALSPRSVEMSLSGGLSQTQVDGIIAQIFIGLPQAIGLVDRTTAELQKDRKLAKSVVKSFQSTGHGLVTYAEGLNPVPRTAAEANVAAGTVYRVLDAKGQGPAVITRYLDRAALDARRNGQVIVLGTTSAQTVSTLVNWAFSNKARSVALAPVSASLRASLE